MLQAILRWLTFGIYAALLAVVLYFPIAEFLVEMSLRTRYFLYENTLKIEDSLLPCFVLALAYAIITGLRRMLEQIEARRNGTETSDAA